MEVTGRFASSGCQPSTVSVPPGYLISPPVTSQSFNPPPPLGHLLSLPSSDTVCWPWKVPAQDEICHRGGQLSQGEVEEFGIQARVVADAGAPGNHGVLHAVGDIPDSWLCQLHHVFQLVGICLRGGRVGSKRFCYSSGKMKVSVIFLNSAHAPFPSDPWPNISGRFSHTFIRSLQFILFVFLNFAVVH